MEAEGVLQFILREMMTNSTTCRQSPPEFHATAVGEIDGIKERVAATVMEQLEFSEREARNGYESHRNCVEYPTNRRHRPGRPAFGSWKWTLAAIIDRPLTAKTGVRVPEGAPINDVNDLATKSEGGDRF